MTTLIKIIFFLIQTFGTLYLTMILLRFMLQLAKADFYNPISQLIVKLTNPLLIPLRKVIPGLWGIDFAALVLAVVFHLLVIEIMLVVAGPGLAFHPILLAWSFIGTTLLAVHIYMISMIVMAISSFIAPHSSHPILLLVRQMNEPLMAPFRKIIPSAGGLDFSMFFAMIILSVIRITLYGLAQGTGAPIDFLL